MTEDGHWLELVDRQGVRCGIYTSVANAAGAILTAASGALTDAGVRNMPGFGLVDVTTLAVYLPFTMIVGTVLGRRHFEAVTAWIRQGRAPGDDDQRRTLKLPLRLAAGCFVGWLGAVALWSVIAGLSHPAAYTVRVALSILLGGLTTTALTYLLVEQATRPLVALTLQSHLPAHPVLPGVRTRLIASWAVGADVFLLMIGLAYLGRPPHEPPSPAAIWFIVATGLVAGTAVVYVAARLLAEPMAALRSALSRVQAGDLSATVRVDDGGEIGLLQAGFNHMVAGLRERDALNDLFGRQVGPDVARRALETGVVLGGERRQVAVLFVDILGSTEMAQRRSPEEVVGLLNSYFAAVIRAVSAEGGWVNKFEGDGALCVFGAPIELDSFALRALRAARTVRRELLALAAVHPELDAAIGVSAGWVVAGNVGAEQRYEYTVIGTPVNEAARLTDQAKRRLSRVLASEDVVSRAGEEASGWMVADEMRLRGMSEPTLVYEPAAPAIAPAPS